MLIGEELSQWSVSAQTTCAQARAFGSQSRSGYQEKIDALLLWRQECQRAHGMVFIADSFDRDGIEVLQHLVCELPRPSDRSSLRQREQPCGGNSPVEPRKPHGKRIRMSRSRIVEAREELNNVLAEKEMYLEAVHVSMTNTTCQVQQVQ